MSSNANKTVTLTVDVQAKLSDLQGQVKKMQEMLGGLKMPDNLAQSVKKDFDDLFASINRAKELTEKNKVKLVDEKKIQSEYDTIEKGYSKLIRRLNSNRNKIGAGDFKAFDVLTKQIEKYGESVKGLKTSYDNASNALERYSAKQAVAQKSLNEKTSYREKLEKQLQETEENFEKMSKIREEYFQKEWKSQKVAQANWNKRGDHQKIDDTIASHEETYNKLTASIEEAKAAEAAAQKEFESANKAFEKQKGVVEELKERFNNLSAVELGKVKKTLADLQKNGSLNLEFDPMAITSVKDLKDKLDALNLWDNSIVKNTLSEIGVIATEDSNDLHLLKGSTSQAVDAFKEMDNTLESFKSKAAYFFGMVNAVNLLRRAVRSAFETVKDLDKVMTETAVVTDFSVGDMWAQLPEYTKRANELGVSIHDAYEAATLYYQQGLKTNEVIAVSNETLKMARIAGLGAAEATDRMTNALRGFNMEINEESAQRVNDVYSKLAAITAADTDEISTAMTKVASLAHNANMEFETTSAFLSQMIETTRESAETAGTALKTVIARFSEVKKLYNQGDLMGTDEEGEEIDVNKVSQALRSAGINLNEYLSGAKGLDDIFIELAGKWQKLDMVQQRYIATMAAGSRQQSRFIAMMSDYDRTMQLVNAANTSAGASQKQFEKTLDSLQSKLAQLNNSWDTFLMGIADDKVIKAGIDILTKLIDTVNKLFEITDNIPIGGSIARIMGIVGALKLGQLVIDKLIGQAGVLFGVTTKQAIADMGLASATEAEIAAKKDEIAINQLSIFGIIKKTLASKAEAAAIEKTTIYQWLQNKATNGSIAAKISLALADTKLIKSEKALAVATGAVHLGLLAVGAAAIYAGYKLIKFLTSSKSAKDNLDDATKSADAAADAVNQTAEAYNNLKDSIADLNDKAEGLEGMVRGTKEWRDAVQEVNNEVLQLMSQYEGLRVIREDGILKIDQASYDEILGKRFEAQNNAQAALVGAQQKVAKLEIDVAFEDLNLDNLFSQEDAQVFLDRLNNGDFEGVKRDLSSVGFIDEEAANSVIEKLLKYGDAIQNSTAKTDEYSKVLAQVATSQANVAKDSEEYANNFAQRQINSYKSAAEEEAKGLSSSEMRDKIAQGAGYKDYKTYKDKTGKEIAKKDAETQFVAMRQMQLASESIKQFAINLDNLDPIFKAIYSREDGLGLTGEMLSRSDFDLNEAKKNSTEQAEVLLGEAKDYWSKNAKELESIYGDFDTFYVTYSKVIIQNNAAMDQAKEKFEEFGGAADALTTKLSSGALSDLGDNLQLVFDSAGEEGARAIQKEISDIVSAPGMDAEKAERFVNSLNGINWKSANALDTFKDTLKELEINIPEKELDKLIKDIDNFAGAIRKINLEDILKELEKFGSLAAKIKSGEQGYTGWSKENMEAAVTAGVERADFYFDAESGTFTYIGNDVHDIYELLLSQNRKITGGEELERQINNAGTFEKLGGAKIETDDVDAVKEFLLNYAKKEETDLSVEAVEKRANDEEALLGLFTALRENWYAVEENTVALQEAKEIEQQIADGQNSILENAAVGNHDAVMAQARQYGVPDDILKRYGGNKFLAQIGDVYRQAGELGFDKEELAEYVKELKKAKPLLSEVEAHQIALFNKKQNDGLQKLVDSYEDWTALIKEDGELMTDLDADSGKTLSDMKAATEEMLNVSDSLSDSFYKDKENLKLLKETAEGSVDAFIKLQAAAGRDILVSLGVDIDDSEVAAQVSDIESWLMQNAPDLEVGATIDDKQFVDAANRLIEEGKVTAAQLQSYFNAIGFDPQVQSKTVTVPNPAYGLAVGLAALNPIVGGASGGILPAKTIQLSLPSFGGFKYIGNNKGGASVKPSSGGSGGSKSEKTDTWENPYDELYNLTEKINESLRTREALERRYEKLVKKTASTIGEVTKAYYDQIRQLRTEADLQYQMQAGRARQLNNVGNEYYMDDEGNRRTFAQMGVTKYASYNQQTGLLQIDWSGLEALEGDPNKVEEGKAAEAYISRLEELQDQFEEVRDKLWDIEDQIEELREEAIENYLTFEDRVMDALVDSYQRQIDEYSTLSDQIKEQTDAIIKGIQDDVALSRQIRDNTKKEEDIADKEARLAYLRRDTSGANALEIKKLEEEIGNARESYSDTLVDQQLTKLSDDANAAAEQRQHQIEIMQNQLDVAKENGTLWGEVWDLINTATAADGTFSQNTELVTLLEESEAYQSLSKIGQMKWWEEVAEAFKRAQVGLSEAEDKYGVDANGDGKVTSSGTSSAISSTAAMSSTPASAGSAAASTNSSSAVSTAGSGHFAKVGAYEHPMAQMPAKEVSELQQALNAAGFTDNDGKKLAVDGKYGSKTRAAVYKLQQKLGNVRVDGYYGPETRKATLQSQFKAYKTGGLADYTGPAWLDGSKTHPELVLNAKDTENFIELKNILAHSMGTQGAGGINNGDTYYEFNIDAELGSDYDVEKLADKIKRLIYNDSSYRNVNSINFMR